jgi:hypothetical protein
MIVILLVIIWTIIAFGVLMILSLCFKDKPNYELHSSTEYYGLFRQRNSHFVLLERVLYFLGAMER